VKTSFYTISFPLFTSLLGFYIGNVLPTTSGLFDFIFPWSHFIAIGVILVNESIGFIFFRIYSNSFSIFYKNFLKEPNTAQLNTKNYSRSQKFFSLLNGKNKYSSSIFLFSTRCFQFSLLFGLFVDAFKVGS
jgi:hypothetical protein